VQSSAATELDSFWARDSAEKKPMWRQIADHKDDVLFEFATRKTVFYYVTTSQTPNGRVMAFDAANEDISKAQEILPQSDIDLAKRDRCGVIAALDALYVYGIRKGTPVVIRIPYDDFRNKSEIPLPAKGSLSDVAGDYRAQGFVFTLSSRFRPASVFRYNPSTGISEQVRLR
jgi:protease II